MCRPDPYVSLMFHREWLKVKKNCEMKHVRSHCNDTLFSGDLQQVAKLNRAGHILFKDTNLRMDEKSTTSSSLVLHKKRKL